MTNPLLPTGSLIQLPGIYDRTVFRVLGAHGPIYLLACDDPSACADYLLTTTCSWALEWQAEFPGAVDGIRQNYPYVLVRYGDADDDDNQPLR